MEVVFFEWNHGLRCDWKKEWDEVINKENSQLDVILLEANEELVKKMNKKPVTTHEAYDTLASRVNNILQKEFFHSIAMLSIAVRKKYVSIDKFEYFNTNYRDSCMLLEIMENLDGLNKNVGVITGSFHTRFFADITSKIMNIKPIIVQAGKIPKEIDMNKFYIPNISKTRYEISLMPQEISSNYKYFNELKKLIEEEYNNLFKNHLKN